MEREILVDRPLQNLSFAILMFVSPFQEFVGHLKLQKDQEVLDMGCGIGGSAFYMANVSVAELGIIHTGLHYTALALTQNQ